MGTVWEGSQGGFVAQLFRIGRPPSPQFLYRYLATAHQDGRQLHTKRSGGVNSVE